MISYLKYTSFLSDIRSIVMVKLSCHQMDIENPRLRRVSSTHSSNEEEVLQPGSKAMNLANHSSHSLMLGY